MSEYLENCGIYKILCRASGKCSIGSAVNFKIRFKNHKASLRKGNHHSVKLQNAWNKYGEDAFDFCIVEYLDRKEDLISREQYWLDFLCAVDNGFNICRNAAAPMLGIAFSDEHKAKIGFANRGRVISDEAKEKMRQAALNRTPEVAAKIAASRPKQVRSEESNRKTSESLKGRKLSEETKAKIGDASRGRKHSEESKAKRVASRRRNDELRRLGLFGCGVTDGESADNVK